MMNDIICYIPSHDFLEAGKLISVTDECNLSPRFKSTVQIVKMNSNLISKMVDNQ